jgi:hypothetical protein
MWIPGKTFDEIFGTKLYSPKTKEPTGPVVTQNPDGSTTYTQPDGSKSSSISNFSKDPQTGITTQKNQDGTNTYYYPNGMKTNTPPPTAQDMYAQQPVVNPGVTSMPAASGMSYWNQPQGGYGLQQSPWLNMR